MSETIQIALISAGSALFGALIPTILSYLNNKEQNKFELKRDLLNNQKNVYRELMISLQNVINNQGNDEFIILQKTIVELSIYGDNISSNAMNNYYREMTSAAMGQRNHLTNEEHKKFQQEVMNGIRKNLGLKEFETFELIGFRPQN
jgi:hypothetical protein